jgi:hypothetical protein
MSNLDHFFNTNFGMMVGFEGSIQRHTWMDVKLTFICPFDINVGVEYDLFILCEV